MIHEHPEGAAAAFGFVIAGSLSFIIILLVSPPTLWYLPLAREFYLGGVPPTLGMDFYGRCLMSLGVGCMGGIVAYIGARLVPRGELRRYAGLLLGSFALLSVWMAAGIRAGALGGKMLGP